MNGNGPYLTMKEAAEFCGYAPATFRRTVKAYRINRYGPKQNKFSQPELESWMQNPEGLSDEQRITSTRKPKPLEV
jgi:predicted DNA-binding transcriptional regulator AlpA